MKHNIVIPVILTVVSISCVPNGGNKTPDTRATAISQSSSAITAVSQVSSVVTMTSEDGVVITGTFYPVTQSNAPTILCLHQWRSDRGSYATLAKQLNASGFAVLAIDMRGYGDSQKKSDGSSVTPDRNAVLDVKAAVKFLRSQSRIDGTRIGILGASYGSSNALIYAADDPAIKAVALLSPGLNYFNVLPTEPAMKKYGERPVLAICSKEDLRSVEAVEKFRTLHVTRFMAKVYDNAGHGTDMFGAVEKELVALIVEFFLKQL